MKEAQSPAELDAWRAGSFLLHLELVEGRIGIECLDSELGGHQREKIASELAQRGFQVRKMTGPGHRHRLELEWGDTTFTIAAVMVAIGLALSIAITSKPPAFTGAAGPTTREEP